ncbi:MAG: prepilin-type N-terminal cleavage/methylation domain-containing protein [Deltaproteobacteria bacterium]|jgi:prepilin-type N-terminal cleavage/methylation domain-containing protein|nr:prepilin-type N-terminal cleavage/methylation domain-containing protein [Deltaproteobacteria bacterium]
MTNSRQNIVSPKPHHGLAKGFTLVELLIAVCVLAFGALATINMHIASLKGKNIPAYTTFASAIAETEMERLKALPYAQVATMSNNEVTNLNQMSQQCAPGPGVDCSQHIFTRRVKFYPGNPTSMSCHVEIEVTWTDSAGERSILYSSVLSSMKLS